MLTMFRNMLRSKVAGLLFALVIVSMAVWGVEDIFSGSGGNVIRAGDRGISITEFDENVQKRLREVSRQEKRAVTKAEAVETGLVDQLFQEQLSRLVVVGYGEGIGGRASSDGILNEVVKAEVFQDQLTNRFSKDVYESTFQSRRELVDFEQAVRDDLTQNYVLGAAAAAIDPPSIYTNLFGRYEGETRAVSILRVDSADVSDLPEPNEDDLLSHFNDNKTAFGEPERRGLTILHFSPEDFRETIEISEEDLRSAYEAGKVRLYSTPQTRRYVEAAFETEADAILALGGLGAGVNVEDLENVVSYSELTSTEDEILDSSYAQNLFGIAQGGVIEPIARDGKWLVAQVLEITLGEPHPFEDVRQDVRSRLLDERSQSKFDETARNIMNLVGQGISLQEVGQQIGAPAISYAPVDAQGVTQSSARILSLTAAYGEGLRQAKDWFENEVINDRFDIENDGSIYLVQIDKIVPPRTPEFEEVKDRVRASWQVTNRGQAVVNFAENLAQRINRGDTTLIDEADKMDKTLVKPIQPLSRSAQSLELPPAALDMIFAVNNPGSVVTIDSSRQGEALLVSVDTIQSPTEEVLSSMRTPIRNALIRQLGNDLQNSLGAEIEKSLDIDINYGAYNAYKARNTGQ